MRIARASAVMAGVLSIASAVPAFAQTLEQELAGLLEEHPQIKAALKGSNPPVWKLISRRPDTTRR